MPACFLWLTCCPAGPGKKACFLLPTALFQIDFLRDRFTCVSGTFFPPWGSLHELLGGFSDCLRWNWTRWPLHPPHLRAYILSRQRGDSQPSPLAARKSRGNEGAEPPVAGPAKCQEPHICIHWTEPGFDHVSHFAYSHTTTLVSLSLCSLWPRLFNVCGKQAKISRQHQGPP